MADGGVMQTRQYWIPYLSDNVYRLTGLGSKSSLPQVRQAVKRIEAGLRVGITPEVPLSALLGEDEIKNLSTHLQQVSSDMLTYICHKLFWFLEWVPEGINIQSVDEVIEGVPEGSDLFAHQSDFLYNFFCFLRDHDPEALEDSILSFDDWYNDESSDNYLVEMISKDLSIPTSTARELLYEAQHTVAKTVLEASVNIAVDYLEGGNFSVGREILSVVVNSPLEDDWEDAVLMKVSSYVNPIVSRIQATLRTYQSWKPGFVDPHAQDCEKVISLVQLLRGRVTQAREWESVVQAWIDKLAVSMSNYAVEQVNEVLNRLPAVQFASNQTKIETLKQLRARLQSAQQIIKQALNQKVSDDVKRHLSSVLSDTQQLLAQLPPIPVVPNNTGTRIGRDVYRYQEHHQHTASITGAGNSRLIFMFRIIFLFIAITPFISLCFLPITCATDSENNLQGLSIHDSTSVSAEYSKILQKANNLFLSRKYLEASQTYAKVIRIARDSGFTLPEDVYYKYGVASENTRNRSTAIWAYQTYITRNPDGTYAPNALRKLEKLGVISRPRTGQSPLGRGIYSGHSEIVIDNQTDRDALVKIIRLNGGKHQLVRNLYVRSGSKGRARQIPKGEYIVKVAYGKGWDKKKKKFLMYKSFSKSEPFVIVEYHSGFSIQYSVITITLHKVYGGNFSFQDIRESEF